MATTAQGTTRHKDCALCWNKLTSPRILPCFHTYCLTCLEGLAQIHQSTGSFPCPTCRKQIQIPHGGVKNFQVNFYIDTEPETPGVPKTVARRCEMCQSQTASHKCLDCDQFACAICSRNHSSVAATRSHNVLSLDSLQLVVTSTRAVKPVQKKSERFCGLHKDEKMRFFCTHCQCVICRDCKLTSHEGHKTTDLSQKAAEVKSLISHVTQTSRKHLQPLLHRCIRDAESMQTNMIAKRESLLSTLRQRAGEIKTAVDSCLMKAERELQKKADEADKTVHDCLQEMQQELACFLSLCDHVEGVTRTDCDADILELPNQMRDFFGFSDSASALSQTYNSSNTFYDDDLEDYPQYSHQQVYWQGQQQRTPFQNPFFNIPNFADVSYLSLESNACEPAQDRVAHVDSSHLKVFIEEEWRNVCLEIKPMGKASIQKLTTQIDQYIGHVTKSDPKSTKAEGCQNTGDWQGQGFQNIHFTRGHKSNNHNPHGRNNDRRRNDELQEKLGEIQNSLSKCTISN